MLKRQHGGLGLGGQHARRVKAQMNAWWDVLLAQTEVGEGLALSQGTRCTGSFLDAAQVKLVNFKRLPMRSVI